MEINFRKKFKNCFIVAEISGNHNKKINHAKRLIYSAKKAGFNAVKLQTYTADTITLNSSKKDFLLPKNSPWNKKKNLWNLYKSASTPWNWHHELFKFAKKLKINIFSSPCDESAVEYLESINCEIYKIPSPEITHIPLLEKVAKTKKNIIISTGLAKEKDLDLAVKTIRKFGNNKILITKCTTAYPAPMNELNLKMINYYKRRYKCLVGYSDHTIGEVASITAVQNGAVLIEKHICLNNIKSVDDFFSLQEKDLKKFVQSIRDSESSIGKIIKNLTPSTKKHLLGRRSIYVSKSIKKGSIITKNNVKIVRPSFGMHPKKFKQIIGKRVKRSLKIGDRILEKYLL